MAGFLNVPEKMTDPVDFRYHLSNILVSSSASSDVLTKFQEALGRLNELRSGAVSGVKRLSTGTSLENALCRYIDQLCYLDAAIPPQHVQVPFTWKNSFTSGTVIVYYTVFTQQTLSFEKTCILFNLAAYLTRRAAGSADLLEEEGLREATKLLQRSAGIFQYIRHVSSVSTLEGVTSDLHHGTLLALENLCLAQAQECFYLKALQDQKAPGVLARLAQRSCELYETAWKHMKEEHPCSYQWAHVIQFKARVFLGAAHFHQAGHDGKNGRVGDELARLALAMKAFRQANKEAEHITILVLGSHWRELYNNAELTHEKRHHENECIFKERITPIDELPPISPATLAKTTSLEFPLTSEENLFENLPQSFRSLS